MVHRIGVPLSSLPPLNSSDRHYGVIIGMAFSPDASALIAVESVRFEHNDQVFAPVMYALRGIQCEEDRFPLVRTPLYAKCETYPAAHGAIDRFSD